MEERFREHIVDAKKFRDNAALHKAMRQYGYNNFTTKIIEDNIPESQLDSKEKYYIKQLNSRKEFNNYNLTDGGSGTFGMSKLDRTEIEQIYLLLKNVDEYPYIDEIAKQFNVDESTIAKINKGIYWHNNSLTYPIRKTKTKRRYNGEIDGDKNPRACKVKCIELDKTFDTIKEANNYLGVKHSHISACCRGERNTALNYHWEKV